MFVEEYGSQTTTMTQVGVNFSAIDAGVWRVCTCVRVIPIDGGFPFDVILVTYYAGTVGKPD